MLQEHEKQLNFTPPIDGVVTVTSANPFGAGAKCKYWERTGPSAGTDRWLYKLTGRGGEYAGPFSHPTEHGCKIMIHKHFIEIGLIAIPEDNSHLDEKDQEILRDVSKAYAARTERPRVGDFVLMPDGTVGRCCHRYDDRMQTTGLGGCYSISRYGVSYSGGLDSAKPLEQFEDTKTTRRGKFWFFHHDRAGAGRGVDCFLNCAVYKLKEGSR